MAMQSRSESFMRCFVLVVACLVAIAGCGGQVQKTKVNYTLARKAGNPVLSVGKLTIVFDGIQMKGEDASLQSGFFYVPHPGSKATGGTATVNELKIKEDIGADSNKVS